MWWPIERIPGYLELAAAWADDDDPRLVMIVGSGKAYKLRCPNGHYPRISQVRFLTAGCPHCRGAKTTAQTKSVAELQPELAAQWHPTRNGRYTPENVVWNSERVMWWNSDCCGYEWEESVCGRDGGQRLRCPFCRTILGSLAWHDPGLAAEWSSANPVTAWHVRPHAALSFVPQWICATDPDHVWNAPVGSRSDGAECPTVPAVRQIPCRTRPPRRRGRDVRKCSLWHRDPRRRVHLTSTVDDGHQHRSPGPDGGVHGHEKVDLSHFP